MLKIKRSHLPHFEMPHLSTTMQFSSLGHDDDELTHAVAYAYADEHDNNWELSEQPDADLPQRWETIVEEVRKDPDWIKFDDDEAGSL